MQPTCLTCGSEVEEGATKPRVERARKLAELYDMTLDEIYFIKDA